MSKCFCVGLLASVGSYTMDDYVFKSREADNLPLTREQALNILKDSAAAVGIKENSVLFYERYSNNGGGWSWNKKS